MIPFIICPVCGGDVIEKEVEKILLRGKNTAIIKVKAEVCSKCGERIYSVETIKQFEKIRNKLERQETSEFILLGQTFQVA